MDKQLCWSSKSRIFYPFFSRCSDRLYTCCIHYFVLNLLLHLSSELFYRGILVKKKFFFAFFLDEGGIFAILAYYRPLSDVLVLTFSFTDLILIVHSKDLNEVKAFSLLLC